MKSTYQTHIGWVRQINEDSGCITTLNDETMLVVVADGVGGHRAGDVASKMAIEIIQSEIMAHWQEKNWDEVLTNAVETANHRIYEHSRKHEHLKGMGTTLEVGLITPEKGIIAHVGDSRVYMFQNPLLRQLTEDHSLVYALYKNGQITSEEAKNHPQKNMILRAIGTEPKIDIDLIPFTWKQGDKLLFCTDGLSDYVEHVRLCEYLSKPLPIEEIGTQLLQFSLEQGGEDNITFIVVENTLSSSRGGEK